MSYTMKLLLVVMFAMLLHCNDSVVEGARDIDLESQLRILNKTPVKTIQMEEGDVFDCIDINKQPSFDHPLLNNHIIKTRPVFHSVNTMIDNNDHEGIVSSTTSSLPSSMKPSSRTIILRKLGCPDGTVPIRKISEEDLIRAKSFSKFQLLLSDINHKAGYQVEDDLENPGQNQFLSIAKTRKDSGIDYLGIEARINIYNPPVAENQVSTAQLWIENGSKEELNSLQAGWIVAPSLLGDNKTRLFGKWQKNGPKSEGCYNILCPGFIQVNKDYPIGAAFSTISQFEGVQYDIKVTISQDDSKNWWLSVEDIKIGYWPVELGLQQLSGGSSVIAWGGSAEGAITSKIPPTGNGYYPFTLGSFRRQCYMRQMKVIPAKTLHWEDPTSQIIDTFVTNKDCSEIIYYQQIDDKPEGYQHTIAFGGPGGDCGRSK